MIVPVFSILSTAAPVTAIVGTNAIWKNTLPQAHAAKRAYITWATVGGSPENYLDGVPGMDSGRVQIDCWVGEEVSGGTGAKVCQDLMIAVRNAIEPHAHMIGTPIDDYEKDTKLYRYMLEFQFWELRS
jgi:hypothetical protein